MNTFIRNLDELLYLSSRKDSLTYNLKKKYKENIHYIRQYDDNKNIKQNGGQNKITYLLTEEAFELFKNSYNFRNRYIIDINDKIKCVNVGMCIENQTIGFIENSFKGIIDCKRQFIINKYRVDLYFINYKLIIECDENNHEDRNPIKEKFREEYLLSLGNNIIRYNPNEPSFDLSNVLREINRVILLNSTFVL